MCSGQSQSAVSPLVLTMDLIFIPAVSLGKESLAQAELRVIQTCSISFSVTPSLGILSVKPQRAVAVMASMQTDA